MPLDNPFVNLHRWATRQDENYLTECLVTVCRTLLARSPVVGMEAIHYLTGGLLHPDAAHAPFCDLRTQVSTDNGRPDLEIVSREYRVFVEVKLESALGPGQLRKYRQQLSSETNRLTRLVLLTRYHPGKLSSDDSPDCAIRWYELAEKAIEWADKSTDPVCSYLCRQFVEFLRERNMHQAQVGWEMLNGVRSLRAFLDMLAEAITGLGLRPRQSISSSAFGWYLDDVKNASTFWVGITSADPNRLEFLTDRTPIDLERAAQLGRGQITDGKWQYLVDLAGEEIHFFCRPRSSQLNWLQGFIMNNVETALSLVVSR